MTSSEPFEVGDIGIDVDNGFEPQDDTFVTSEFDDDDDDDYSYFGFEPQDDTKIIVIFK